MVRNPGWGNGIRIGSAKDGSLRYYVQGTRPEGMGADNEGNVFAGLDGRLRREPLRRVPAEMGEEVNHSNSQLPNSNSQATGQIGSWELEVGS